MVTVRKRKLQALHFNEGKLTPGNYGNSEELVVEVYVRSVCQTAAG